MSESGNFDDMRGDGERVDTPVDPYTTESSADIYATPEVSMDTTGVVVDDTPQPVADTHGLFSGSGQSGDAYGGQAGVPYYHNSYQGGAVSAVGGPKKGGPPCPAAVLSSRWL